MANRIEMLLRNKKFLFLTSLILIIVGIGAIGPELVNKSPYEYYTPVKGATAPTTDHLLGTTKTGRDVLAQLTVGTRQSLIIGILAGLISIVIALMLGGVGGYIGGFVDETINMFINVALIIPLIPLLIVIRKLYAAGSFLIVALIIGVFSWSWTARSIRSQVLSLKERNFVDLAKISGKNDLQILFGEIFPNMLSYIMVSLFSIIAAAITLEASISILGLGPSGVSLGIMIQQAISHGAHHMGWWWWFLPPSLILILFTGSLIGIVSVIDEVLNPKLRRY